MKAVWNTANLILGKGLAASQYNRTCAALSSSGKMELPFMLMGVMGFWLLENRLFVLYRGEFHDCVSEADLLFGWS